MKIYVDELPKSCDKCPFNVKTMFFSEKHIENAFWVNNCKLGFSFGCRLQSIADHDKQVRMEVCEEVREAVNECRRKYYNDFLLGLPLQTEKYYRGYDFIQAGKLTKILDQIQGETK